jgi:hypothetical protein
MLRMRIFPQPIANNDQKRSRTSLFDFGAVPQSPSALRKIVPARPEGLELMIA